MGSTENKLIAEFMGAEVTQLEVGDIYCPVPSECGSEYGHKLKYHTSWDWLMPVVEECLTTGDRQHFVINDALLTCNIEEVYKAVVEFIKEYNNG